MAQLSDSIERFIKELMSEDKQIEVRRNELAQHFGCAPSQINYVLATRFSVDHGYVIESRRGGGGFVRIVRVQIHGDQNPLAQLMLRIGNEIPEEVAVAIIAQMKENGTVTAGEASIMKAAVSRIAMALPVVAKDVLRASVLKNMLKQVYANLREEEEKNDV